MTKLAAIMNEVTETNESEGLNLSVIFQQRAKVRTELSTGLAATLLAKSDASAATNAVEETANAPLVLAAQAIASGLIGKDDFSEMLCETFGRKEAKEGKVSKTPEGYGLTIRKRAVCLSEAIAITNGEVASDAMPKWTEGKDVDDIATTVAEVIAGTKSGFVAYNELTKKERAPAPELLFNPEKLAKLAEDLAKPENAARILQSPALVAAYQAITLAWATASADVQF